MILLHNGGKAYRCRAAFLADLDDRRQADVSTREEVVAFLMKHPDQQFLLICEGDPSGEALAVAADQSVSCGVVQWNAQERVLRNRPVLLQR